MNESFNEHEFTQFLKFEDALKQEEKALEEHERRYERAFTAKMAAEGLPVKDFLETLQDNPSLSLTGLRLDLKNKIEQFTALHPEVNDEDAPYTLNDITLSRMLVEYDHCKILGQFESAYFMYEQVPNHPDLLKDVQYEILQAEYLGADAKSQWNSVANRYMPGDAINMEQPDQDEFVITRRQSDIDSVQNVAAHTDERQEIYNLLNKNGDAFGLRNHDDNQEFMSRLATAIIYEQTEFADFQLRMVYDVGEKIGLSSAQIETIHHWTRSQLGRLS